MWESPPVGRVLGCLTLLRRIAAIMVAVVFVGASHAVTRVDSEPGTAGRSLALVKHWEPSLFTADCGNRTAGPLVSFQPKLSPTGLAFVRPAGVFFSGTNRPLLADTGGTADRRPAWVGTVILRI
jgi:hypothetical protein